MKSRWSQLTQVLSNLNPCIIEHSTVQRFSVNNYFEKFCYAVRVLRKCEKAFLSLFLMTFLFSGSSSFAEFSPTNNDAVVKFITKKYEYGVPCEEAKLLGSRAVPQLSSMLEDQKYEAYWENIVFSLGCIGDPEAVQPLKNFLSQHQGQISFNTFTALQGVPTALGFISYLGDKSAVDALTKLADNDYWQKSKLRVLDHISVTDETVKHNLMRSTILALGFAQQQETMDILELLKQDPKISRDFHDDIKFATDR